MVTSSSVQSLILDALTAAGVHARFGPLEDMPAGGQAAVLWPMAGAPRMTRAAGGVTGRGDGVQVQCVGRSALDALAVVDRVDAALLGLRVTPAGGLLVRDVDRPRVLVEPNSDPARHFAPVIYSVVTKG